MTQEELAQIAAEDAKKTPPKPTMDELKAKVAAALASGNDTDFMLAVAAIAKQKSEIAKAQAEQARKESEALAGVRMDMADRIRKAIDKAIPNMPDLLAEVKAFGFHYTPKGWLDANNVPSAKSQVGLTVPQVKAARKATTGGASTIGKTKSEFGMSLGEVYDKFANDEEKAKMAEASTNSAQWQVKVAVKNRAIKEGLLVKVS